ncbi:nucleoporin Nup43 [Hydra vulgaris]|uniref:Nucleoporin Nup43 n=1 Tax=Hydra vulgaris TaxID=6087 RepID=A0ABM4DP98_HYDVU
MNDEKVIVSFVGQKISKVRWGQSYNGEKNPCEFITGSCDDEKNLVCKWKVSTENDNEPNLDSQLVVEGSVTDLLVMSPGKVIYSNSNGDVSIVSLSSHDNKMKEDQSWKKLHRYLSTNEVACCTCLASYGQDIVTGGEDGKINLLLPERKKPIRVLENADSSNVTGLQFLSSTELVSINSTGQLKLWDIRQQKLDKPEKVLALSGNACPLLSVDKHPNQSHIVVTGHGDGVVGIWDIRQENGPVTLVDAHEAEVWTVMFHPLYPDNLFTCSQDGSCWFWDGASMNNEIIYSNLNNNNSHSHSAWLYIDANKHKMETFSLVPFNKSPINSFDVCLSSLVCATDSEALIIVSDIPVR